MVKQSKFRDQATGNLLVVFGYLVKRMRISMATPTKLLWTRQDDVRQFVVRREVKEGKKSKAWGDHGGDHHVTTMWAAWWLVKLVKACEPLNPTDPCWSLLEMNTYVPYLSTRQGPKDPAPYHSSAVAAQALLQGRAEALDRPIWWAAWSHFSKLYVVPWLAYDQERTSNFGVKSAWL